MSEVSSIIEVLESTSSRNDKIAILKTNKDNATFRRVVHMTLNPLLSFYIKKIPAYTPVKGKAKSLDGALDVLVKVLATRKATGQAAIDLLSETLSSLSASDAKVLVRVVERDLRCGVDVGTVNKAWPKFIRDYPCMLATAHSEKAVAKITYPAHAQLKMDGMRFNAVVDAGDVRYFSRNGKPLDLLGALDATFLHMANDEDMVFDGELWVSDGTGLPLPRQTGNGILSKAQKGTLSEDEAALIRCTLWDVIPLEDFENHYCSTRYDVRFDRLQAMIASKKELKCALVEYYMVRSLDEARLAFKDFYERGEEGIILKTLDHPWENKRSRSLVKFKGELECDLRCVGWEEGTGKNKGRLGALVLESEDGEVRTNVGTGFTDEMRDTIGRDVIGKVIAIKYNARIVDTKTGQASLFLPVFIEIRDDKDTADSGKDIK